jgi:sporulation protein YlmC with PRC-barrel domain
MDIPLNAKASCLDGICGKSTYLILMPTTEEITHVVVSDESFPGREYLVPIGRIAGSTPETIRLNCNHDELLKMPVFNQAEFIPSGWNGTYGSFSLLWPYVTPETDFIEIDNEQIPTNELAIRRGASVEATDGHIGSVDEFLINPIDNTVTHLVLREGHLWGQKNITIPMSQIDRIEENSVWLKLDKQSIEALPAIPIHHGLTK